MLDNPHNIGKLSHVMNTTEIPPSLLRAINAQNKVNRFANECSEAFKKQLIPFIGKKVLIQGNSLAAKFGEAWDKFRTTYPNPDNIHFFISPYRNYDLSLKFSLSYHDEKGNWINSAKAWTSICKIKEYFLSSLQPESTIRADYDAELITTTKKEIEKLEASIRDLKGTLGEFSDRNF